MQFGGHFGCYANYDQNPRAEFVYDDVGHIFERIQLHWFLFQFVGGQKCFLLAYIPSNSKLVVFTLVR